MKKIKFLALAMLAVTICSISSYSLFAYDAQPGTDIPDEGNIMHCRCKHGGCYAGNWISFRGECATSEGAIDCTQYASNCP